MNTDVVVLQNELTIAKLQNEILELKYKLQKTQAEKTSRLEDSLFSPALFPHYQKVAETLSKSSVVPTPYRHKPEDIFVAMAMGYQLGFPVEQSLQDIAVINGRPCLWGDGLLSLVLNHPECMDIKEEAIYNGKTVIGYTCTVLRKGHEPHTKVFTMQDAERAGLLKKGGVWLAYPERMLQMRARSLALRDKFADALRGLRIAEVEEDDSTVIDAEPVFDKAEKQVDKLKKILTSESSENTEQILEDKISSQQLDNLIALMDSKDYDEERKQKVLDYFKVSSFDELTQEQFKLCTVYLLKR